MNSHHQGQVRITCIVRNTVLSHLKSLFEAIRKCKESEYGPFTPNYRVLVLFARHETDEKCHSSYFWFKWNNKPDFTGNFTFNLFFLLQVNALFCCTLSDCTIQEEGKLSHSYFKYVPFLCWLFTFVYLPLNFYWMFKFELFSNHYRNFTQSCSHCNQWLKVRTPRWRRYWRKQNQRPNEQSKPNLSPSAKCKRT